MINVDDKKSDTSSFELTFKNPCIDQDFVTILAPTVFMIEDLDYIINAPEETFPAHGEFTVNTLPFDHGFCLGLTFVETYDIEGAEVDGSPLSYDDTTGIFTA